METKDPKEFEPKPPFPDQKQEFPGSEEAMTPEPDFGERSYRGSGRLQGKAALITGADSGIGRAVALAFAREGADVLISCLEAEQEDAEETLRVVTEAGRKGVIVPGDISNEAHCRSLVRRAIDEFGRLDILVNNAAYQKVAQSIEELPTEEFDRIFKVNVYAMYWLSREALRVMKPGSSIINTTSVQAYQPDSELLAYATTKGAIVTFTKGLAKSAIEKGIRVNAVAPGPVWTPLIPATLPPEQVKDFGKSAPIQRAAQPVELAPIYVLLASDEASYMTGDVYGVAGGLYLA